MEMVLGGEDEGAENDRNGGEGSKRGFLDVKLSLRGPLAERFLSIKKARGILKDSEVLRFLVDEYFDRNLSKSAPFHIQDLDEKSGRKLGSGPGTQAGMAPDDREFVREELAWIADWIRRRYPKLMFQDIRNLMMEILLMSV